MNDYVCNALTAAIKGLSLAEKGTSAAKVILTGLVVVFAMFIFLILIIKLYSFVLSKLQKKTTKKEKIKIDIPEVPKNNAPPMKNQNPRKTEDGISEEVVAVISTAVAAMYGSSEKVKIKSIKKSGAGHSAWANAGIINNTRPF